jgi:ferrous iron transport protein A
MMLTRVRNKGNDAFASGSRREKLTTTLDKVRPNQSVKVIHIEGGIKIRQRLHQLGIYIGDVLRVKRSFTLGGPILIATLNADIAIGRGMAKKITIDIL